MQRQVPRISIQYAVDPAEHSRVSGEPPCFPEDSDILFLLVCVVRMLRGLAQHPSQYVRGFIDSQSINLGSVNGLICVFNGQRNAYICNPTITKSKELPKFTSNLCTDAIKCGFGYDESSDDYKVVFINYPYNHYSSSIMTTVVKIYSLRINSWTTLHDQLQGIFLLNHYGRFVNGKLYWTSSTGNDNYKVCNITSFDLADGTWGSLELPSCGKDNSDINVGVVGSDLSMVYTCHRGAATSDVWIMKHSGANVSWTKLFTIKYPQNIKTHRCFAPSN
uniref:F-box protein n=1 Tax=Solanum tuberosum TaxID=4113 RepID=M1DZF8_SOLTU